MLRSLFTWLTSTVMPRSLNDPACIAQVRRRLHRTACMAQPLDSTAGSRHPDNRMHPPPARCRPRMPSRHHATMQAHDAGTMRAMRWHACVADAAVLHPQVLHAQLLPKSLCPEQVAVALKHALDEVILDLLQTRVTKAHCSAIFPVFPKFALRLSREGSALSLST